MPPVLGIAMSLLKEMKIMFRSIKSKIVDALPPLVALKLSFLLSRPKRELDVPAGDRVYIFIAADYGNMGDVAITYSQKLILQKIYPQKSIVEVPTSVSTAGLKYIYRQSNESDIVTVVGGGNMGDAYDMYELYRQLVLWIFRRNKSVSFPQTVEYSNRKRGQQLLSSAKSVYSGGNLVLLAREDVSFSFISNTFMCKSLLVPDVVMTLKYDMMSQDRHGALFCFRNDREKSISQDTVLSIKKCIGKTIDISYCDTWIGEDYEHQNRVGQLFDLLRRISSSRLFVTDRLHGMIFAFITRTPAIVFSNTNWKIARCFEWIKDCGYIKFCDTFDEGVFMELVASLISIKPDEERVNDMQDRFTNMIVKSLMD